MGRSVDEYGEGLARTWRIQDEIMDLMEPPACMRSPVGNKPKGWFAHMVGMAFLYRA